MFGSIDPDYSYNTNLEKCRPHEVKSWQLPIIEKLINIYFFFKDILFVGSSVFFFKVSKDAKIRNRYNQVPHLTQDTNGKVTNSQLHTTNESQEVSFSPSS